MSDYKREKRSEPKPKPAPVVYCGDCASGFREVSALVWAGNHLALKGPVAVRCDCNGGGNWKNWFRQFPSIEREFFTHKWERQLPPEGRYPPGSVGLANALRAQRVVASGNFQARIDQQREVAGGAA